jgi:subtilisin family serine protease
MISLRRGVVIAALLALLAPASAWARNVEVVVRLGSPGVAEARAQSRVLTAAARQGRLDLSAPTTRSSLDAVAAAQRAFEARLARGVPAAHVYRRYRIVFNGLAISLPSADLPRLAKLADVYPNATYRRLLDRSVGMIGLPAYWSFPGVNAGEGAKIAILDDGLDQSHPFFSPAGYTMPPGFPKGVTSHTTAKVIVARAFPPRGLTHAAGPLPFDPEESSHATHVGGIAAGNGGTLGPSGARLSGVAPRAYLGNYKVLAVPTDNFGLNGNAPEIAAGIEAAVVDGMDVINLSLGQPEIEPTRDLVALAIEGAAAAGVPTVAAAGNVFGRFRAGSVGSPASAAAAIAVGSVTTGRAGSAGAVSPFSSSGPAPVSLRFKPEVAAPGSDIVSSVPGSDWMFLSGTSMAAPHVSGVVALLRRRHPTWTPAQIKSALVTTARPNGSPLRTGGGIVDATAADAPLLFAEPSTASFELVAPTADPVVRIRLSDAGGGAGPWSLVSGATPRAVTVPGELELRFSELARRGDEDASFVVLQRGDQTRRIPYWYRVAVPRLPKPMRALARTGTYTGSTIGRPARVQQYRYPELTVAPQAGPEQLFRVTVRRPVANFGVAVLSGAVQPRVVVGRDENRLVGMAGLPLNINPYVEDFGDQQPVAGAVRPAPGVYGIVFDSRARGSRFTFRFWIDDVRPPTARLVSAVARGGVIRVRVADAGAGVDPRSLEARVGQTRLTVRLSRGVASIDVGRLVRGSHALVFRVSDYQEAKNMENVATILPNTRTLRATIRVLRT